MELGNGLVLQFSTITRYRKDL